MQLSLGLLLHQLYFKAKLTSSSVENMIRSAKWTKFNLHTVRLHSSAIYFVSLIPNTTKTANTFPKYWYRCNKEASMDSTCSPASFCLTYLAGIEAVWLSYLKLLCDFKFPLCGLRQLKASDLFSELHTDRYWQECQCVTRPAVYTHTLTHMCTNQWASINSIFSKKWFAVVRINLTHIVPLLHLFFNTLLPNTVGVFYSVPSFAVRVCVYTFRPLPNGIKVVLSSEWRSLDQGAALLLRYSFAKQTDIAGAAGVDHLSIGKKGESDSNRKEHVLAIWMRSRCSASCHMLTQRIHFTVCKV